MVIFLGRDCHFLGQIGNSITCDEMVIFLRRDFHFIRTSWRFHNLGRVGHVLWTRWSPFNKFGKLKILRGMHFVIIGGIRSNYWGGYKPPISPCFGTAGYDQSNHKNRQSGRTPTQKSRKMKRER